MTTGSQVFAVNIEWTPDLEIGVDAIDEEHRSIIELYNRIYQYYDSKADEMLLERAISDFRFLFSFHFLREENYMTEIGYPDFESHAKEHEIMVNLLNKFSHGGANNDESCQKIAFLVLQWLSSHLEGADRTLAKYAKQRGLTNPQP